MLELQLIAQGLALTRCMEMLEEAGALAITTEDANAGTDQEQPLFGEPGLQADQDAEHHGWEHCRIRALFDNAAIAHAMASSLGGSLYEVPDTDWVRQTQSQFSPVAITADFWIVPSWHEPPAEASTVLRLDPGLAFGTGTHPTTWMCLRWLAQHGVEKQRVLDYGCGSGILAIAAALLKAHAVHAVDVDPHAVQATQDNALVNRVAVEAGQPDFAHGLYDVVLANILASPLKVLAPLLCRHVRPGGYLVLAGILARQAGEITQAYAPWMVMQVQETHEGWVLMVGQKPLA